MFINLNSFSQSLRGNSGVVGFIKMQLLSMLSSLGMHPMRLSKASVR